ncbi:hypothetical protein C8J57DRAFT_1359112 [Mycena rebaudengoi]|nr:hypothetical protein C8J57DRAFT_1359112 [Mycena rebaudengoi]
MSASSDSDEHGARPATDAADTIPKTAPTTPQPSPGPPGLFSLAWVLPALRTRRTLKTTVRSILAFAGAIVLIADTATLQNMGQAGFFGGIIAMLLPPSLALALFVITSGTLLLGMVFGWAWGVSAMVSALHVRDKTLLASRLVAAQKAAIAAASSGVSALAEIQSLAFHGFFLDSRSSAVYGAFFFIGTFVMAIIRVRAPRFIFFSIYGTIVLDVICTTGPLLPTPNYTLAKLFLLPTCYYLAIAITSLIFIFPESLNHVWLTTLDGAFFGPLTSILTAQSAALKTRPSDHAAWAQGVAKSNAARAGLSGALAALGAQIGLIDLEVSVGRLGPSDLKRFAPEIRALGFRASGLLAFQTAVSTVHADDKKDADALARDTTDAAGGSPSTRFAKRRRLVSEREALHNHTLDDLLPILQEASAPLHAAAETGVLALRLWLASCNIGRWASFVRKRSDEEVEKARAELKKARDDLQDALKAWRSGTEGRVKLIAPFERFFDKQTGRLNGEIGIWGARDGKDMFAARSLFICFVFCDTLDAFAARLHRVLSLAVDLDTRRTHPRVWFPSGVGKLWRRLLSRQPTPVVDEGVAPLSLGTEQDPTRFDEEDEDESNGVNGDQDGAQTETVVSEDAEDGKATKAKNPDARKPTSLLGRASIALGSLLHFFATPEGLFALRYALLSVALWVPAVVPRTAWFYYSNKGLWALIMGQLGLATYAGDAVFGAAIRIVGTGLGLLNGMVVWYIAAPGKADGNPYAMVVVMTVFVAPVLCARIASPPAQMMFWLMTGVTTVLVVGFSWLDTHMITIGSQGVGVSVGWRRAVLVIIGFAAAGLMMLFPRPTSARTLVRRTLAATLQELGCIFGQEAEAFLSEEARARAGHLEKEEIDYLDEATGDVVSPKERRVRRVSQRVLVVFERLRGLGPSLMAVRWEPQVQGLWPGDKYAALHAQEMRFGTSLALLTGALAKLDPTWCSILVYRTPFLNPNLLSDVFSAVDILSHSLETGRPIPASLLPLRERLMYHETFLRLLRRVRSNEVSVSHSAKHEPDYSPPVEDSDDDSHAAELIAGKVDGASIGFEELSLSVLMDEQLPTHSTAVIALGSILAVIDEIMGIVRELCGERTFRQFDALHQDFLGREERIIGTG